MNPVHIAPSTALPTLRRTRRARRVLLPVFLGSCALPLTGARAQTPPIRPAQAAANSKASADEAALLPTPVRTLNKNARANASGKATAPSATPKITLSATPSATPHPTSDAAPNLASGIAPGVTFDVTSSNAPRVASSNAPGIAPDAAPRVALNASKPAISYIASATVAPVRLAQITPKDTEAPATPRETGPQGLTVPLGPETPPKGTPAVPPPDTSTPPPRVPRRGLGVIGNDPVQQPIIGDVRAAEGREISEVRVVGSRVVPADTILAQVRLQRGQAFSSNQAQFDIGRVNALGFFSTTQAQVTPDLNDPDKVVLTYIVEENRVISGFEFTNNTSVKAEELLPLLTSKVGVVLNRTSVAEDIKAIEKFYQDKGFAVQVQNAEQIEDGKLIFDLSEATISKINIVGLNKTREDLVRRQIRIKPGDTFNRNKMFQDANRLYDTGFFDAVEPRPDNDPNELGAVEVNFVLRERRTGQVGVGVGFDSRSKLSGYLTLSENNLRGTGQRGVASIQTGSQRNFELATGNPFIGDKNASYDVSIYQRSLFRQPNSINRLVSSGPNGPITDSEGNAIVIPNNSTLQEQRTGGRINFTKPLDYNRRRTLIFGYRNERAEASIRSFNGTAVGVGGGTDVNIDANNALGTLLDRGTVSAASIGFLRDSRDLRLDPSSGGRESFVVEQAVKFLGGNTSFTKLDLDLRRYLPIIGGDKLGTPAKLVLAGRVVVGRSVNQLPIFEQYYVGGTETVRGYNTEQQFGDNQLYGNAELRYRFQRAVTGVLFADSGTAYGGRFSTGNDINLLTSVGFGVRLVTPIGPIRLDYGIGREGGRTHFGIGSTF